jgi:RNA polymerase sigma factor (TIGR02999 family)
MTGSDTPVQRELASTDGLRSRRRRVWPWPASAPPTATIPPPRGAGCLTEQLNAAEGPQLHDELYRQLRGLARRELARIGPRRTLSPTALVNEAWLKLVAAENGDRFACREHFLATMAKVMRHVLIDYAREQGAQRRGGAAVRVTFDSAMVSDVVQGEALELLAIDRALTTLARLDARLERVVELRFFAGLTIPEIARTLGVSEPTIKRELRTARAFIAAELGYGQ